MTGTLNAYPRLTKELLPPDDNFPGEDAFFMELELAPGIQWEPHHSVGSTTDQIDGKIGRRTLDVWYVDGKRTNDLRENYPGISEEAAKAWEQGTVLCKGLGSRNGDGGIPSILIPGEHFTEESIVEAFRRFRP